MGVIRPCLTQTSYEKTPYESPALLLDLCFVTPEICWTQKGTLEFCLTHVLSSSWAFARHKKVKRESCSTRLELWPSKAISWVIFDQLKTMIKSWVEQRSFHELVFSPQSIYVLLYCSLLLKLYSACTLLRFRRIICQKCALFSKENIIRNSGRKLQRFHQG